MKGKVSGVKARLEENLKRSKTPESTAVIIWVHIWSAGPPVYEALRSVALLSLSLVAHYYLHVHSALFVDGRMRVSHI